MTVPSSSPADQPGLPRPLAITLSVWMLLQLGRLIAIPLIQAVQAGSDHAAWLYPAILDVVVAAATLPAIATVWRAAPRTAWSVTWTYLVVSIVDHGGAIITTLAVGMPATFRTMFDLPAGNVWRGILMGPGGQAIIDAVLLLLLWRRRAAA